MRIEKITFMQTFPTGQFANQKLGVEIVVEDDDIVANGGNQDLAVKDAFRVAKSLVNDAFNEMNPQYSPGQILESQYQSFSPERIPEVQVDKTNTEDAIEKDILNCKDMAELDTYRLVASTTQKLKEAYNKRLKELKG